MKCHILSVILFSLIFNVYCDLASEKEAYAVEVIIYRLTTDIWTAKSMETTFAGVMASAANSYCESVSGKCGLTTCCTSVSISFKETDVGKVTGYPQKDSKNLKHKFSLQFPTGFTASNSSVTQYVVVNSDLYEIIRLGRTTFHTQTGYWITWADETYYGVPATTLENQIIIPIAFVVLFLVIFLAIGLHFWNKKKQNEARLKKKIDNKKAMKKNQAMVQPTYRVDPEIKDIDEEHTEKTGKESAKKPRKEKMYVDNYPIKQSEETGKKHLGGASDTDSAIKMENDLDLMESKTAVKGSLPPLDNQEEVEKKKKKKKKDKKKKHHEDGYDNQSANLSTEL